MDEGPPKAKLLVLIARHEAALDDLITGLLDVGAKGATVLDGKGMGAIIRDEMPIFAGLAALLPQQGGSKVVLSITNDEVIEGMKRFLEEMSPSDRPLGFVLPVETVF